MHESQLEEDARREESKRKKRWRALEDKVSTGTDNILVFDAARLPQYLHTYLTPFSGSQLVRLPAPSDTVGERICCGWYPLTHRAPRG